MTDYSARIAALLAEPSTDAPHDGPRQARGERSRVEMLAQGDAMRATLAAEGTNVDAIAARLAKLPIRRVVIAGCGDSWAVAIALKLAFERLLGVPTDAVQALDWALYSSTLADAATVVIGISSSGRTEAVVDALTAARRNGAFTIGVSNTADTPVLIGSDGGLLVRATRRGWPTQSSTSAAGVLWLLAARWAAASGRRADEAAAFEKDLRALPDAIDVIASRFDAPAKAAAQSLAGTPIVLLTGAGSHYAAAAFGTTKIKELSPIHAISMPLEEYHHYRSQKRGDPLFLVAPDQASAERALDVALYGKAVGGRTIALLPEGERVISAEVDGSWYLPQVRTELAPVAYAIPLHLFAYHFASARFAAGLGYPGANYGQPAA
jgi:glucosamine--fructose-6-phosphate aminotransferase (isomerizing)